MFPNGNSDLYKEIKNTRHSYLHKEIKNTGNGKHGN